MAVKTNLRSVAASSPKRQEALVRGTKRATATTRKAIGDRLVAMSSGRETKAQLAASGYPYAQKHRNPRTGRRRRGKNVPAHRPPEILNVQSNQVRKGWKVTVSGGTDPIFRLTNVAPHYRYLGGTKKMVPRPTAAKAMAAERPQHTARMREARNRALSIR